jgi:hypothetical protein
MFLKFDSLNNENDSRNDSSDGNDEAAFVSCRRTYWKLDSTIKTVAVLAENYSNRFLL